MTFTFPLGRKPTVHARTLIHCACVAAMAAASASALAGEFTIGDGIQGKYNASVSYGTTYRTEEPDPGLVGANVANRVPGMPAGKAQGANAGSSDVNFANNTAVSTVLRGVADVELKKGDYGVFVRAQSWQDFALTDASHPYGNYANGYTAGKLSDNGFDPEAKFANTQFMDYYVFGKFDVGAGAPMDVKLGRQYLNWGAAKMVGGGVNIINPTNGAGATRPGATAEESKLPVGMLSANLQNSKQWGAEAFAQYEFRPNVYPGCGTFYQTTNYVPAGCNYVSVLPSAAGGGNDPTQLANGRYAHRNPDQNAQDGGQYGLSMRLSPQDMNTDFRLYAMNLHNRTPSIRVTNANIPGSGAGYGTLAQPAVNRLTDPNGLKYGLVYGEQIQVAGASFESKLAAGTQMFGELAYRPNQPINLNASDLIGAFLQRSATSALNQAKGITSIPAGGTFDGFDRFAITNVSLGVTQIFPKLLGAERLVVVGEIGFSNIAGLPGADRVRYGRSDDYGAATYAGAPACPATSNALACAQDGFVTASSWGYRLRAAATYAGVMGATVTPSLYFAQDVQGYSYDSTYVEGRRIVRPALRFDWDKKYFAETSYTMNMGGLYNSLSDRDTFSVSAGMSF